MAALLGEYGEDKKKGGVVGSQGVLKPGCDQGCHRASWDKSVTLWRDRA